MITKTCSDDTVSLHEFLNPNSAYWEATARRMQARLEDLIGDDIDLWTEIAWGESTRPLSWMEKATKVEAAIHAGWEALMDFLECTCSFPERSCRVCRASARLSTRHHSTDLELRS